MNRKILLFLQDLCYLGALLLWLVGCSDPSGLILAESHRLTSNAGKDLNVQPLADPEVEELEEKALSSSDPDQELVPASPAAAPQSSEEDKDLHEDLVAERPMVISGAYLTCTLEGEASDGSRIDVGCALSWLKHADASRYLVQSTVKVAGVKVFDPRFVAMAADSSESLWYISFALKGKDKDKYNTVTLLIPLPDGGTAAVNSTLAEQAPTDPQEAPDQAAQAPPSGALGAVTTSWEKILP